MSKDGTRAVRIKSIYIGRRPITSRFSNESERADQYICDDLKFEKKPSVSMVDTTL